MYHIGIVGKPSRRRFQIVNQLEGSHSFRVHIFSSVAEARIYSEGDFGSGLIWVDEHFSDDHIQIMDELTEQFPHFSFLCLVTTLTSTQRDEFQRYAIRGASVLDYNHELKDIKGLCKRMLSGEQRVLREHNRYQVSKSATLFAEKGGGPKRIQLVDISKGGLQARVFEGGHRVGERVQIQVPFDRCAGGHVVIGRVAWINEKGFLGVRFDQVISKSHASNDAMAA
jgi:hypothetical protein